MHAEKLIQALQDDAELRAATHRGVADALRQALRTLERSAGKAEGRLDLVIAALERALSEAVEASDQLARIAGDADLDPRHLEEVEERLFTLWALARKHAVATTTSPGSARR